MPGGVFATFGYLPVPIISTDDSSSKNKLAQLVEKCRLELSDLWEQPGTDFLNSKYTGLKLPFNDNHKINTIKCSVPYSGQKYFDYITSWSAYNELMEKNPEKAKKFTDNIVNQLKVILETDDVFSAQFHHEFEFFLLMSRKPEN